MEVIVAPGGQKTEDEWVLQNVTVLFAVIYFFVTMRVRALSSGEAIDREGYVPLRREILSLITRARKEATVGDLDEDVAWEGFRNPKTKEFDDAVARVNAKGWLTGDWYQGISDVVKLTQRSHLGHVEVLDKEDAPKMQVKKADTMFQDKFDLLSEAKRTDYKIWREGMLAKIDLLTTTASVMEVDTN